MERDTTLDIAKGILIILVVLGHAIQFSLGTDYTQSKQFFYNPVFTIIYSFHMPLFMLISGYLFYNSSKKDIKTLVKSKLLAIGVPMLSFLFLGNLPKYLSCIIPGYFVAFISNYIRDIGGSYTMWFLFSILLNMSIIAIIKNITYNKYGQYSLMILIFIGSLFIPDNYILGVHKYMFPFFCIGYVLKQNNMYPYYGSTNIIAMIILTLLSIGAIIWFDINTYIYTTGIYIIGDYTHQLCIDFKRMVIALIVSYTFMQYVQLLSKLNKGILYRLCLRLGQISLFIYGFNIFFDTIYTNVLSDFNINFEFNYLVPLLFTTCLIVIASYTYKLSDKYKVTRLLFLGKHT